MNQDQSQTGPVPQTAADLHAAVRGMPLPGTMTLDNGRPRQFWENGVLVTDLMAALALEGWYSRMLDERMAWFLDGLPGRADYFEVCKVSDSSHIADGPTKLHALVAALKTLGVGVDPGATS